MKGFFSATTLKQNRTKYKISFYDILYEYENSNWRSLCWLKFSMENINKGL